MSKSTPVGAPCRRSGVRVELWHGVMDWKASEEAREKDAQAAERRIFQRHLKQREAKQNEAGKSFGGNGQYHST